MPLIDTPPDAAARVYARSLFELAEKQGGQTAIEETVAELEEILDIARSDPKFGEFLSSPSISTKDRAQAIKTIFSGRVSDLVQRFLLVLNEKGRIGHLPSIAAAFDQQSQEKFGRIEIDAFTAAPLPPEQVRQLRDRLGQAMGKEVVLHPYTDATMIGGVKFRIGDQLVDASVATRLRKMKDQLDTEGGAELRSRISRIIDDSAS
jgi:F-type H+-transporting ATPase subunit delta